MPAGSSPDPLRKGTTDRTLRPRICPRGVRLYSLSFHAAAPQKGSIRRTELTIRLRAESYLPSFTQRDP